MSSDREQAAVEQDCVGHSGQVPSPAALSAKKLWRIVREVHLVFLRGLGKHQPNLAALGVNLRHHMLSSSKLHHHLGAAAQDDERPTLMTYLSAALSCRSMDPATAVHPYPSGAYSGSGVAGHSSLSCRSMDPGAAVYEYRPREVEFSCKRTPPHRRHRRAHRRRDQGLLLPQKELGDFPEYGSSSTTGTAVKTLFELMDDDEDDDMETPIPWAATATVGRPAPRQVRITDSPFLAREKDQEGSMGVVDRRADEFILWFHDQLRMQQQHQQQRPAARDRAAYWVR